MKEATQAVSSTTGEAIHTEYKTFSLGLEMRNQELRVRGRSLWDQVHRRGERSHTEPCHGLNSVPSPSRPRSVTLRSLGLYRDQVKIRS